MNLVGCPQANNSIPIIQQTIDFPQRLGTIFYNSISQNQSYGVADALRWMLRPVGTPVYAAPSTNMTEYDRVSASLGATIAYAMNYAYHARANLTIDAPPNASNTILRSSTDPLVQVKPNSRDVFFVAAAALMGAVFHGCDADWHCHSMDCDLPEEVVEKRTGVCCPTVSPMLTAISRQLLLLNLEYLVDAALPASVQAAAPTTLEFLARCNRISSGGEPAQISMSACNINASANYMCNVWVYCGSSYGCPGCDNRTLNYQPGLGAAGQTFGPYGPGCSASVTGAPSFPTYGPPL
ncbi:hypothetical protein CVIRNUC_004747 [Coccomyxa viridis]|uniref:Extracellular protein n=1 Tax=Coccomyxa viridis TaxID=1274662 RepID=A0AAV1I5Q3_9CHLO|nr:hypothetical protein CVIRNUC_004747 [Coccomyxa viridis]